MSFIKRFLVRYRERDYIEKIQKTMSEASLLRYLTLNSLKDKAAQDLIHDKITEEFYTKIFCGGDMYNHWSEKNKETITTYF